MNILGLLAGLGIGYLVLAVVTVAASITVIVKTWKSMEKESEKFEKNFDDEYFRKR